MHHVTDAAVAAADETEVWTANSTTTTTAENNLVLEKTSFVFDSLEDINHSCNNHEEQQEQQLNSRSNTPSSVSSLSSTQSYSQDYNRFAFVRLNFSRLFIKLYLL